MFENWENFYLIVGSGAGALIGLMFVAATLTAGYASARTEQGAAVFMSPIVFHLGVVLVVGAMATVPDLPVPVIAVALSLLAGAGLIYSSVTLARMFGGNLDNVPDLSDKLFYGFAPVAVYIGLSVAAGATWVMPDGADYGVGAAMLALLLIGIRNAWDLALFFVLRSRERPDP
jgi:hypothetical protein